MNSRLILTRPVNIFRGMASIAGSMTDVKRTDYCQKTE